MNITNFNYQRNGVAANGFYSFITNTIPNVKAKGKYCVTFESAPNDNGVEIQSVRVVDIKNPLTCWRGDEVGFAIAELFHKSRHHSIYNWKESFK